MCTRLKLPSLRVVGEGRRREVLKNYEAITELDPSRTLLQQSRSACRVMLSGLLWLVSVALTLDVPFALRTF